MKKHEKVRKATQGQVSDVFASTTQTMLEFLPLLSFEQAKYLVGHKKLLANSIRDTVRLVADGKYVPDYLVWWDNFYQEKGIDVDYKSLDIPKKPKGRWWPILVVPKYGYWSMQWHFKELFGSECRIKVIDNMDEELAGIIHEEDDERQAKEKPYLVWVKARVEADKKIKSKNPKNCITLLERFLLEAYYNKYIAKGQHLDIEGKTVCAGSWFYSKSWTHPTIGLSDNSFFRKDNEFIVYSVFPKEDFIGSFTREVVSV